MTINLDDGGRLAKHQIDSDEPGWWVDEHVVSVRTEHSVSVFRLPKGRPRVVMSRLGNRRAQLIVGGFTTTTVAVNGPVETIKKLREAVL